MFDIVFDFFIESLNFFKWYIPIFIIFAFVGDMIATARDRRR